jgi:hypothetical protein
MTREDKLYSMRMQDLVQVAENLGIKINTKASKSKAIEKILAAEEMNKQNEKELAKEEKQAAKTPAVEKPVKTPEDSTNKLVPMPGTEDPNWGKKHYEGEKPERKRGALIEYKGKAQNICAWAKELGKSANTLYSRIYILGWSVEDAFNK